MFLVLSIAMFCMAAVLFDRNRPFDRWNAIVPAGVGMLLLAHHLGF